MALINKSYSVTLNQRVVGSIPTAPTINIKHLADSLRFIPTRCHRLIPTKSPCLFFQRASSVRRPAAASSSHARR
jgi:hypothetical protein